MTKEKIRQKAIECAKTMLGTCCNPCKDCEYGEYFLSAEVSCMALYGYEHGFADGVEEGKKLAIKHAHWTPTEYDGYADGNPVWDVYTCSACGDEHYGDSDTLTDFCPCCGARMDEEGEQT